MAMAEVSDSARILRREGFTVSPPPALSQGELALQKKIVTLSRHGCGGKIEKPFILEFVSPPGVWSKRVLEGSWNIHDLPFG